MTRVIRDPIYRLWIEGRPLSRQGRLQPNYARRIREVAAAAIRQPIQTRRIDVEIFFVSPRSLRADVDNVIKPILDALEGIAFMDDFQVRSVKATRFPEPGEEAFGIGGPIEKDVLVRLFEEHPKEFLVNIYEGMSTPGGI